MADALTEAYIEARPGSAAIAARARGLFAARGATHFARVMAPFRPYIVRAAGSRKWDVDGHEYLDYVMGHGALILGHSHPAVVNAIVAQSRLGLHYGDSHPLEVEWAERIRSLMPAAERIEYFASGQEANQMGIRLARVATGRTRLLRFKYNYHGWSDELAAPGTPGALADQVTVIPSDDPTALERELATREYAVVLMEGGGSRLSGRVPVSPDFFRAVPPMAERYGTVVLLDEVVSGFREAVGGWQSVVRIRPDLTSIGKAVSGGMAAGALLGRADLMAALSPDAPPGRGVAHGGTWNAVPITCAAGIAACDLYLDGAPQRAAAEAGQALRRTANEVFRRRGLPARLYGRSICHVYLGDIDRESDDAPPVKEVARLVDPSAVSRYQRLELHLLTRGIATTRGEAFTLSAAHTSADIAETAEALAASVGAIVDEGSLTSAAAAS